MLDQLLAEFLPQSEHYQMTERRMQRIVQTAAQRQRGLMALMEDVHNPHNLQAIARSCDAFGIQELGFTLENEDLFDPTQVGKVTASGAAKWLDYRIFTEGTRNALTTLQAEGYHVMASWVNPEARSFYEIDFTRYERLALMVGNEKEGISPAAVAQADSHVFIPMQGFIRSFNVSVATAICLAEITRQRRDSTIDFALSETDTRDLIHKFLHRA